MIEISALLATVLLIGLIIFQLLLASGQPLGRFAWGGQHPTVLPMQFRIASLVAVVLYAFFAFIILNQAGVIEVVARDGWAKTAIWILTVYLFIGVLMNAISRSKSERMVMTPLTLVLAGLFLYVALGS
jgi:hypothetical protein